MITAPLAAGGVVIPDFSHGHSQSCARLNKTFCWDWFSAHWGTVFWPRLLEHVVLTLIAVGIGAVIAFVAALFAYRRRWFETPFTLFTAFLYTIPSLALFQILVPFTGLTRTTAEIALVSYTLLIIFRNVLTGLRDVPEEVREAARGMGLGPRMILWRIELPLALPAIVAGLRIATVTVISLATIASFVIDEGLGAPIQAALQNQFKTEFIAAGALTVGLALAADAILVAGQRLLTPWARAGR